MHTLNARLADSKDVSSLLGMMEAFNLLEGISWNASPKETALRFLLDNRSLGVVVMLEIETRPVGYFVLTWGYDLEWDGRDAFLTELFLVPEVRGQGLGGPALEWVEALAGDHGARALHLMVRQDNSVAQRLYASHGYESPPRVFLSKELVSRGDADVSVPH